MKLTSIILICMLLFVGGAFATEKPLRAKDMGLKAKMPCNNYKDGPYFLETLFKGAHHPQFVCFHSVDGDEHAEIALIKVYNPNDKMFELIRVMMLSEYHEMLEKEHAIRFLKEDGDIPDVEDKKEFKRYNKRRPISSYDRSLKKFIPCKDHVDGPYFLETILEGSPNPQYICFYSSEEDDHEDIALIYTFDDEDGAFKLIKAMRLHDYFEVIDYERAMSD